MSDNVNGSFAAVGSGKSTAEVAFELLNKLKGQGVWGERNMSDILDMYAECLDATNGHRAYKGQNRVDNPVQTPSAAPRVQVQTPVQTPAQAPAQQPVQHQPQQAVHQQQAAVQQAFKQG